MSSAAESTNNGPSSRSTWVREPEVETGLHRLERRTGQLLVGENAQARPQHDVAGDDLGDRLADPADGAVGGEHELRRRAHGRACGRAPRSRRPAPSAPPRESALASDVPAVVSGAKRKPSSRPTVWPSTTTSPVLVISVSSIVFSRNRRINTLVRRSTKRSASLSCSASDSRSSMARVTPCQCSGSASQSGRFAANVQVLICAIRVESVSISPSVRSACSIWWANQSSEILPSRIRKP